MSLFQPSNITPDVLTGSGVVSASEQMAVSWQVNGLSPLVGFILQFSNNDTSSTPIADTGIIWLDEGFYGTDQNGNPQFFSYDFKKSWHDYNEAFTDGGSYKMKIIQAYLGLVYGRDSIELLNLNKYYFTYQNQYFTFKNEAGRRTVSLYYCPETGVLYEIQKNGNVDEYKFLSYEVTDSVPTGGNYIGMTMYTGRNAFVMPYGEAVFDMKTQPGLSISEIPNNTITQPIYTFTGNFWQPQGDIVSFARWIAEDVTDGADNVLFDTGNINTSVLQFTYNQFFSGRQYKITLMIETDGGQTQTASKTVSAVYEENPIGGQIETVCGKDGGVCVTLPAPSSFPATVNGNAEIKDGKAYLYGSNSYALWNQNQDGSPMGFEAPYAGAVKTALRPLVLEGKVLEKHADISYINAAAYSADGSVFAYTARTNLVDEGYLHIFQVDSESGKYTLLQTIFIYYPGLLAISEDGSEIVRKEYNSLYFYERGQDGMYEKVRSAYVDGNFQNAVKLLIPPKTNGEWNGSVIAVHRYNADSSGLYVVNPNYETAYIKIKNIYDAGFLPFEMDGSSLAAAFPDGLYSIVLDLENEKILRQTKIAGDIIGVNGAFGFDTTKADSGMCYIAVQEKNELRVYKLFENGTASLYTSVTNENRNSAGAYSLTSVIIDEMRRVSCRWSASKTVNFEIYDTGNTIFSANSYTVGTISKEGNGNFVTASDSDSFSARALQANMFRSYTYPFFEIPGIALCYAGNKICVNNTEPLSQELPATPVEVVISILPGGLSVTDRAGSFTYTADLPDFNTITSITARGNVFDYVYFSKSVPETDFSFDFVPLFGGETLFLAGFTDGYNGGSVSYSYLLLRQDGETIKTVATLPPNTTTITDYGFPLHTPAFYQAVVLQENDSASVVSHSAPITMCNRAYMLYEARQDSENKNLYHVLHVYRFGNNLDGGEYASSYNPTLQTNFTPYPYVQKGTQNAWSGTLKALLSNFHNGVYTDTAKEMQVLKRLAVTDNALFLKDMKGNFMQIAVSGGITQNINIKSSVQEVTVSIPWVEIGDTSDVSLIRF